MRPHEVYMPPSMMVRPLGVQLEIADEIPQEKWNMKIITRDPTGGGQSRLLVVSKDPVTSLDELRKLKAEGVA